VKLTNVEATWARDAFEGIFPGPHGARAFDVEGYLAGVLAGGTLEVALGVRLAVWLVALSPLFVLGRLRTLRGLSVEDRAALLVRLAAHPTYAVRQLVLALKALAALLIFGDPESRARVVSPRLSSSPTSLSSPRSPRSPREPAGELVSLRTSREADRTTGGDHARVA
jgi:hypothetical protein